MVRKKVKPKRRKIGKVQQDQIVAAWAEMLRAVEEAREALAK